MPVSSQCSNNSWLRVHRLSAYNSSGSGQGALTALAFDVASRRLAVLETPNFSGELAAHCALAVAGSSRQ